MTLEQKIKLIDDLIRENPDYEIKDYLAILKEVEWVEQSDEILNRIDRVAASGLLFRMVRKLVNPMEKHEEPRISRDKGRYAI